MTAAGLIRSFQPDGARSISSKRSGSQSEDYALRLFCFTFAGGSAAPFFEWRRVQPDNIAICPVEYPGHGSRWHESSSPSIRQLIQTTYNELRPHLVPPYAFLGHSFGAIVAYELARLLSQKGEALPARLILSGARAPHLSVDMIHHLPDPEFLDRLIRFEGVPREVLENDEALALLLPKVRHDFRLFEEHERIRRDPIPVPISVFGGLQDPHVSAASLLAWSGYTTKSFRSRFFPGNHFFLFDPRLPIMRGIGEDLGAALNNEVDGRDDARAAASSHKDGRPDE